MNISGKSELRGVAEYDSVLNTIMELYILSFHDDTVFCSIREINDWMNLAGISSLYYDNSKFIVRDNKITYIEADLSDSSLSNLRAFFGSFMPWAKENQPHLLDSLMPGGNFLFDTKGGVLFLELLVRWRDSTQ